MKKVTIYSRTTCASCSMVKKYLTHKNVEYAEVNLDEHPSLEEGVMKLSGAATVPVVVIEDEQTNETSVSVGYKPAQLIAALT